MSIFDDIRAELDKVTSGFDKKLADMKEQVEVAIEIKILREGSKMNLSRLATLDPDNPAYLAAIKAMG